MPRKLGLRTPLGPHPPWPGSRRPTRTWTNPSCPKETGGFHPVEIMVADNVVDRDPDLEVQEMAIWALGRIGGDEARAALEACLDGDNEALALAAEDSLDEINLFDDTLVLYDFDDDNIDGSLLELLDDDSDGFPDLDKFNGQENKKDYLH